MLYVLLRYNIFYIITNFHYIYYPNIVAVFEKESSYINVWKYIFG